MECPYCKEEMTLGELLCPQGKFRWVPKGTKILNKDAFYFGQTGGFLGRNFTSAYYCKKCKKLILDNLY